MWYIYTVFAEKYFIGPIAVLNFWLFWLIPLDLFVKYGEKLLFVPFLFDFDCLFVLFRIALVAICLKGFVLLAFRLCCFPLCRLNCLCWFPVWCLGRMWNSIVSISDHCLLIYFAVACCFLMCIARIDDFKILLIFASCLSCLFDLYISCSWLISTPSSISMVARCQETFFK